MHSMASVMFQTNNTGQKGCLTAIALVFLVQLWLVPMVISVQPSLKYIAGQRCLVAPAQMDQQRPPLFVLVGMAQTVSTWQTHVLPLSRHRDVIIYEAVGLGEIQQAQSLNDVSLEAQSGTLLQTIEAAYPDQQVDVAGFSLGGRIAMAAVSRAPDLFRRVHLTGVALQRSDFGYLQLLQWKDHLQNGSVRAFAWSAMLASYSPKFLRQSESRLPDWINSVCQSHSVEGLCALMEQAHHEGDDVWSVKAMASRLKHADGRLVVGELDLLVPLDECQNLVKELKWKEPLVLPGVGHAVPLEAARLWRNDLLAYLDNTAS